MNLTIVSWNIRGQYSIAQLIDRLLENMWDLLIVLEPQRLSGRIPSHPNVSVSNVDVGDQFICVMWNNQTITGCATAAQVIMVHERHAALIEINSFLGARYRILTAHAPYRKNDGTAAQFQQQALLWAQKQNIDLVVGDLNTYGSKVGSSSRSHFMNLSAGLATSSGGSPLDKALLNRDNYYGLPSDVNASVMELEDIELPDVSYVQSGERASSRVSVAQSRQGRGKQSDHRPVIVMLPAGKLLSSKPSSSFKLSDLSSRSSSIIGDGHCLYRCIAQILWGDQNRYQDVRNALADHLRNHWNDYPYMQHLRNLGQLDLYLHIIRNTNAWGGEFELATLAGLYNLRITMQSPQGFAQAVYGNGAINAAIRHTGDHFEIM